MIDINGEVIEDPPVAPEYVVITKQNVEAGNLTSYLNTCGDASELKELALKYKNLINAYQNLQVKDKNNPDDQFKNLSDYLE